MEDFISKYSTELMDAILIIAALIGLCYFKKFKHSNNRIFIYYLVYVAFVDFIGGYTVYFYKYEIFSPLKDMLANTLFRRNYWWITLFWNIGSAVFLSYYYQKIITSKQSITIIKYVCYIFLISTLVYIFMNIDAFFNSQLKFVNIFGALVILNCITLYFIEILNSDKILVFYKSLNSIVSGTLLLWWLIITPLVFYEVYFSTADAGYLLLRNKMYLFANLFMYTSFAIAIIVSKSDND